MKKYILKLQQVRKIGNARVGDIVGFLNTVVWHGLIEMVTCAKGLETENKPCTFYGRWFQNKKKTDTKAMRQMYRLACSRNIKETSVALFFRGCRETS